MAINVTINSKEGTGKKKLKIQRNMSGHYVLTEHPELDIVIMPQNSKILMLTKGDTSDYLYRTQDKMFKHLVDKGVVQPESIKVGNVFGSMEGLFPQKTHDGKEGMLVAIYVLSQFLEDERPEYVMVKKIQKDLEDKLLNPPIENSTEFGEVPQETFKGSIPKYGFPTRGIYRYNY